MKALAEYLGDYVQTGKLIGFCRWEDGEGMAWGRILSINRKGFRLHCIDSLGRAEEVQDYLFSDIIFFSEDERYANRLVLLAQFKPTLPETYENITDKDEIRKILEVASKSGEVIRIDNPNDENISATVKAIDGDWVEYLFYADPMVAGGTQWMKIEFIVSVSWRNARTEADGYLLNIGQNQD